MSQTIMLVEKCSHCVSWYDIESASRVGRVPLPEYPHEMIVDTEFRYAYVAHYGVRTSDIEGATGRSVFVIDIRKQQVAHRYDLGEHARPHGMGMDGRGSLYVLSELTDNLLVKKDPRAFDQGWDQITPTGGTKGHLFALKRSGEAAYSLNLASCDVTAFSPFDPKVRPVSIRTGEKPEGRCLSADESVLYVTNRNSNTVSVIDTNALKVVRFFPTPNDPCRIYHDSRRNRLVTMNYADVSFSVFEEATGVEVHRERLPAKPLALCMDARQGRAYIAVDCEQVLGFNLSTFKIEKVIHTGEEPDSMAILPARVSGSWEKYA